MKEGNRQFKELRGRRVEAYSSLLGGSDFVEGLEIVDEVSVRLQELDVGAIWLEFAGSLEFHIFLSLQRCESPQLGDNDLLLTREFVSGTSEGFHDDGLVGVLASNGQDDLADVNSGDSTVRLTPGTSHTRLESICTSA